MRFEKIVIDKLAYADVHVADGQFADRMIDLKDLIASRLREVEIGLVKARSRELSSAA